MGCVTTVTNCPHGSSIMVLPFSRSFASSSRKIHKTTKTLSAEKENSRLHKLLSATTRHWIGETGAETSAPGNAEQNAANPNPAGLNKNNVLFPASSKLMRGLLNVLVVGDGDLSFAASLAMDHVDEPGCLTATVFEQSERAFLKLYGGSAEKKAKRDFHPLSSPGLLNLARLKQLGARIEFGVDACDLETENPEVRDSGVFLNRIYRSPYM